MSNDDPLSEKATKFGFLVGGSIALSLYLGAVIKIIQKKGRGR